MGAARARVTGGFWAWTVLIYAIRSISFFAYLWLAHLFARGPATSLSGGHICLVLLEVAFSCWMLLEAVYLPHWWLTHKRLSQRAQSTHSCKTHQERTQLLEKCLVAAQLANSADDAGQSSCKVHREWLLRWFHASAPAHDGTERPHNIQLSDVCRGNFEEWLSWAFFDNTLDAVKRSKVLSADLCDLVSRSEEALHMRFADGYKKSSLHLVILAIT